MWPETGKRDVHLPGGLPLHALPIILTPAQGHPHPPVRSPSFWGRVGSGRLFGGQKQSLSLLWVLSEAWHLVWAEACAGQPLARTLKSSSCVLVPMLPSSGQAWPCSLCLCRAAAR